MQLHYELATQLLGPLGLIIASVLIGLVLEHIVQKQGCAWFGQQRGGEALVRSLRGTSLIWCALAGIYAASVLAPLRPDIADLAQKVLRVIFILSVTAAVSRVAAGLLQRHTGNTDTFFPSTSLTRLLVFFIGSLIALQSLDISITPILTTLGVGGIAVALALQDTLSNLFSGLYILISRTIRPGNYVKLESGEEGHIRDINWRNTTIQALSNNMVVVPNSKIASAIIVNYNLPEKEMAVIVNLNVGYSNDLAKVERVTVEVARQVMRDVQGAVPEFEPFVRFSTFDDFNIGFSVIMRGREYADQYLIKHEFIKRVHQRYRQEHIEITVPFNKVLSRAEYTLAN